MSNHALASTNIDQEKELSCLILWLEATAQVIGDLLSGFGPARAWIDKHRNELERGKLAEEWHDRVAEFDNGRKEIITTAAKALDYAGRVVGIVATDHPREAIDLLVDLNQRAESFSYLGVLWESLDGTKFTFENEMPDVAQRLERLAHALSVLPVITKGKSVETPGGDRTDSSQRSEKWRRDTLAGEEEEQLSVEDAAGYIKMSEKTIYRMMDSGMPYTQPEDKPKKHRRIRKSDLLAWQAGKHPLQKKNSRT